MKYREASADAFVFESTRIRALEKNLIGAERLERLLNAGSLDRCGALLGEFGAEVVYDAESGVMDREKTLEKRLRSAYEEVVSLTDGEDFLKLWLYPYDCNNIKACIKCNYREVSAEDLLVDFGTISLQELKIAAERGEYGSLPAPFGEAAAEAAQALTATSDPQTVDLILDRACYLGMTELARNGGVAFARELLERKIDLTNLLICLRRLRMSDRYVRDILPRELFLEGGTLTYEYLSDLCRGGEAYLWERLEYSPYRKFPYRCGVRSSLGEAELVADNLFMERLRDARAVPYGAEPLLGYLLGTEYEVKNLRILLSGYSISLPQKTVRERMRDSYV